MAAEVVDVAVEEVTWVEAVDVVAVVGGEAAVEGGGRSRSTTFHYGFVDYLARLAWSPFAAV